MIRYLFFFFLFLPCVSAIAVTPTTLDFGFVESFETRELFVANNLDESAMYNITLDEAWFKPITFYLEPNEIKVVNVTLASSQIDKKKLYLFVDEIKEGSSIVNSVKLPVKFSKSLKVM